MNAKKIVFPVVSLFVICLVASLLLSLTNELTADRIAEASRKAELEKRSEVLPTAAYYVENETFATGYDKEGGSVVGYVVVTTSKGYGGDIKVMTGFNADGAISGVSVLEHAETSGVGSKATKPDFTSQFTGKTEAAAIGKDVDAVTGATISSTAITKAVNLARDIYNNDVLKTTGGGN